jgi:hypothetical protein
VEVITNQFSDHPAVVMKMTIYISALACVITILNPTMEVMQVRVGLVVAKAVEMGLLVDKVVLLQQVQALEAVVEMLLFQQVMVGLVQPRALVKAKVLVLDLQTVMEVTHLVLALEEAVVRPLLMVMGLHRARVPARARVLGQQTVDQEEVMHLALALEVAAVRPQLTEMGLLQVLVQARARVVDQQMVAQEEAMLLGLALEEVVEMLQLVCQGLPQVEVIAISTLNMLAIDSTLFVE